MSIDLADRVAQRLPWLIGATVAIATPLLVPAFGPWRSH